MATHRMEAIARMAFVFLIVTVFLFRSAPAHEPMQRKRIPEKNPEIIFTNW
jgi:hypothetical protein